MTAELLLIGGRSGVGKTVVGWEVSARLRAADVGHAILEGDFLGRLHPAPADRTALVERNLTAVWANFAELGCRRLVYTNTLSVHPSMTPAFERALGDGVRIVRVLLTATDATATARLTARELGSELDDGLRTSRLRARRLDAEVGPEVVRVPTDDRPLTAVADDVIAATGWL